MRTSTPLTGSPPRRDFADAQPQYFAQWFWNLEADMTEQEFEFESRIRSRQGYKAKFWRFIKYLSTRQLECWGFFAAGFLIATIF